MRVHKKRPRTHGRVQIIRKVITRGINRILDVNNELFHCTKSHFSVDDHLYLT